MIKHILITYALTALCVFSAEIKFEAIQFSPDGFPKSISGTITCNEHIAKSLSLSMASIHGDHKAITHSPMEKKLQKKDNDTYLIRFVISMDELDQTVLTELKQCGKWKLPDISSKFSKI